MHCHSALRRRYSRDERRKWVARFRKSPLTQADFAREHDLKLGTLRRWLYRSSNGSAAREPVFKEVPLPEGWLRATPARNW